MQGLRIPPDSGQGKAATGDSTRRLGVLWKGSVGAHCWLPLASSCSGVQKGSCSCFQCFSKAFFFFFSPPGKQLLQLLLQHCLILHTGPTRTWVILRMKSKELCVWTQSISSLLSPSLFCFRQHTVSPCHGTCAFPHALSKNGQPLDAALYSRINCGDFLIARKINK